MTVRSVADSAGCQQSLRLLRGKYMANLFRIQRQDSYVLRFTDHDRALTYDGETYSPVNLSSISAERREAGLRSGNQEASGIIDGVTITIPDLLGHKYRGAIVWQKVVDWRFPLHVFYAETKRIRQIQWDGIRWIATLEGIAARMQQLVGGRFGGIFTTTCSYRLGDASTCRADISLETITDVTVSGLIGTDTRMGAYFSAASWPGTYADDYYRDGEIEWTTGSNAGSISPIVTHIHGSPREIRFLLPTSFPIVVGDKGIARPGCDGLRGTCYGKFRTLPAATGTVLAGTTTQLIQTSGLTSGAYQDGTYYVVMTSGALKGQERLIFANSATGIQVPATTLWPSAPATGSTYAIRRTNVLNFGGSPYDPDAGVVVEQVT